jgi:hypothetical protein
MEVLNRHAATQHVSPDMNRTRNPAAVVRNGSSSCKSLAVASARRSGEKGAGLNRGWGSWYMGRLCAVSCCSIKNEQLGAGGSGRQGGGIGAYADSRRSKSALPVSNTLHSGGAAPVFSLKI